MLVAPDSFKGTLRATEVAAAVTSGLERAGWPTDRCPIADGGEGTMDVLLTALGGETASAPVHDPLGREIEAPFGLLEDGGTAIVETARASGLGLVGEDERDPIAASTTGTGELILAAVEAGAAVVLVGVGGSATIDGGAGAVGAVRSGGGLRGARLVVLCDVRTPYERAAEVFAPQKGADADAVRRLARRLRDLARRLPRDPRGVAMTGVPRTWARASRWSMPRGRSGRWCPPATMRPARLSTICSATRCPRGLTPSGCRNRAA